MLLAIVTAPVLAVPPDKWTWETVWGPDFLVDCSDFGENYDFDIQWTRNVILEGKEFYNQEGSFIKALTHLYGEDIFYNSVSGKQVSGNFSFTEVWYEGDNWFTSIHHGLEIHITLPGHGVVYLQTGTIEYYVTWDDDGNEIMIILHSAGPKMWHEEDFGKLCAALAD